MLPSLTVTSISLLLSVMYGSDTVLTSIHSQIDDAACISRLSAFGEDAERFVGSIVTTHVLKISNLRFFPIEKKYKGACTCPLEFRADSQSALMLGPPLVNPALVSDVPS